MHVSRPEARGQSARGRTPAAEELVGLCAPLQRSPCRRRKNRRTAMGGHLRRPSIDRRPTTGVARTSLATLPNAVWLFAARRLNRAAVAEARRRAAGTFRHYRSVK